jgi:transposase-like protein
MTCRPHGLPDQVFSPGTSPTGVRGHDRHIIIAWNRLSGRPSMPWREVSKVDERREFVRLAMQEGANRRELCRRFGIHPDTGYKWLGRGVGQDELADRSRRPHSSPTRTAAVTEARIVALRDAHPAWALARLPIVSSARRQPVRHIRPYTRSCAGMAGSLRHLVALRRSIASRSPRPICFGKWTSRVTCRWRTAADAIR